MPPPPPALSAAVSRLWTPRLSLTTCFRAVMARDTRGVVLGDAQRFNHFPASPLCSLSWWFHGVSEMLPEGAPALLDSPRLPHPEGIDIVFAGPFNRPMVSWNPGPVHGMMLLLMPDAVHHLLGIEPHDWLNRLEDIRLVLPPDWVAMCQAVQAAPDDDTRVRLIEDFLEPRWQQVRPRHALSPTYYRDWAEGLALRAALSGTGRSLRQVERRIRGWAGQSLRDLRGIGRAEQAFFAVRRNDTGTGSIRPDWASLAADLGYADQSHLCRETRRITGFSPEELRRRIETEEGFWPYRIWE